MSQTPLGYNTINAAGNLVPNQSDLSGNLLIANGSASALNITGTVVVKASPGRVCRLNVLTAPSVVLTVNDCATTGAVATANEIVAIPIATAVAGSSFPIDFPCLNGITVVLGTGTASISFD